MVVTCDDGLAARVRSLRSHGMTTLTWQRHRGHASYDVVDAGFNYRIDEVRAAIAIVQLRRLPDANAGDHRISARYRRELDGVNGVVVPFGDHGGDVSPAHHLAVVVLPEDELREPIRAVLSARSPDEYSLPADSRILGVRPRRRSQPTRDRWPQPSNPDVTALCAHARRRGRTGARERHRRSRAGTPHTRRGRGRSPRRWRETLNRSTCRYSARPEDDRGRSRRYAPSVSFCHHRFAPQLYDAITAIVPPPGN